MRATTTSGRDGARDIDLRAFARAGMRLYGGSPNKRVRRCEFATTSGEPRPRRRGGRGIKDAIDAHITAEGHRRPEEPRYVPCGSRTNSRANSIWSRPVSAPSSVARVPPRPPVDRDTRLRRPRLPDALRGATQRPRLTSWPARQHSWGSDAFFGSRGRTRSSGEPHRRLAPPGRRVRHPHGAPSEPPPPSRSAEEPVTWSTTHTATSASCPPSLLRRTPGQPGHHCARDGEAADRRPGRGRAPNGLVIPNYGRPRPRSPFFFTNWRSRPPRADDRIRAGLWVSPRPRTHNGPHRHWSWRAKGVKALS